MTDDANAAPARLYLALTLAEYEFLIVSSTLATRIMAKARSAPDPITGADVTADEMRSAAHIMREQAFALGDGGPLRLFRRLDRDAVATWGEELSVRVEDAPARGAAGPMAPTAKGALPA